MIGTYIYKGIDDYYYHDVCLVKFGDSIEITTGGIINHSNKSKFYKAPVGTIENLLTYCDEFDMSTGIDDDTSIQNGITSANQALKFFELNKETINKLISLGVLKTSDDTCRSYNIGKSNYSKHVIQPWTIWQDYNLNPWDADIVKRILRTKSEEGMTEKEARILDYEKIIHICKERIRQLS